ncbi:hypothetical protein ACH495_10155 [Micromonospora sp. NPDC018662]|uniref:hypothetical protein n=1 Tax=Micromonospora sp. NPDC018662 TaxID=3364238 RepID=UPI003797FD61
MTVANTMRRTIGLAAAWVAVLIALSLPGTAEAHVPTVTGVAACDAATGSWVVTWTVTSSEHDLAGELTEVSGTPSERPVSGIAAGAALPAAPRALTGRQTLPGGAKRASLAVTAIWQRPTFSVRESASATVGLGGTCQQPRAAQPSARLASTCAGSVTVSLVNAADADVAARFRVGAQRGFTRSIEVRPGGRETVTVPPGNGGGITVTAGDRKIASGAYAEPASCGPQLPRTGVSLPGVVAISVALIMVGVAILFNVRRGTRPAERTGP